MRLDLKLSFPYDMVTGKRNLALQYPGQDAITLNDFFYKLGEQYEGLKDIMKPADKYGNCVPIVSINNRMAIPGKDMGKSILKDKDEVFLLYPLTGG